MEQTINSHSKKIKHLLLNLKIKMKNHKEFSVSSACFTAKLFIVVQ